MSSRYNMPPYFDDFSEMKNYMKVLFKPGKAVQARELTQLQTIIQNQVEHMGRHLFKDGSLVLGGTQQITKNSTGISYLKLQPLDATGSPLLLSTVKPGMIVHRFIDYNKTKSGLTAKIISTTVAKGNDPATLFVVYSNQTALSNKFLGNESLVIIDPSVGTPNQYIVAVNTLDVSVDDKNISTGDTSTFTVSDGLYFYDGKYLQAPGGSLVLDKYSNVPTYKLGYMVKEGIATSISDPTLLDPAISSSNAGGSGADRQKFSLSLYKHGNGVSIPKTNPPGFFEIARIVKGNIEWQIQEALFTKIGDELAKRTFDESGNYVVEFPTMDLSNQAGLTAPSYTGTLSKTLAYVKGYRIETPPRKKGVV